MLGMRRSAVMFLGFILFLFLSCGAAVWLGRSIASANEAGPLLEARYFTQHDALWLARAQVGEAGWKSQVDHDAIAWVIFRRWEAARRRNPYATIARVAQQYCASLKPTGRQVHWLRGLELDGGRPARWPVGMRWDVFREPWLGVLSRLDEWAAGRVPDPTRGRAVHFGSPDDPVPKGCVLVELEARNRFYARQR